MIVEILNVPRKLQLDEGSKFFDVTARPQVVNPCISIRLLEPLKEHHVLSHALRWSALCLLRYFGKESKRISRYQCSAIIETSYEEIVDECLSSFT